MTIFYEKINFQDKVVIKKFMCQKGSSIIPPKEALRNKSLISNSVSLNVCIISGNYSSDNIKHVFHKLNLLLH